MYKGLRHINLNGWIFETFPASEKGLSAFRIFAAGYILLFLVPDTSIYRIMPEYPAVLYNPPPGIMQLFSSFPPEWFFWSVHLILVTSLLLLLIGYKTRLNAILAGICFIILKGFIYSLGKINHDFLLIVVLFTFAFSKWGSVYVVGSVNDQKDNNTPGWPITLIALFLGFMMLTAGIPKILGGWLDPDTHAVYSRFIDQYIIKERQDLLAGFALKIHSGLFWETLDYLTILFEVGFIFAIRRKISTRLFTAFAVLFHFSTMLLINITFIHNFVAYAVFLDWVWVRERLDRFSKGKLSVPVLIIGILAGIKILGLSLSTYLSSYMTSDLLIEEILIVSFGSVIAASFLVQRLGKVTEEMKLLRQKNYSVDHYHSE